MLDFSTDSILISRIVLNCYRIMILMILYKSVFGWKINFSVSFLFEGIFLYLNRCPKMLLVRLDVFPKTMISLSLLTNLSSLLLPRILTLKTSNVLRVLKRGTTLSTAHRREPCLFTSQIILHNHLLPFLLILRITPLRMRNVILIRVIFSLYIFFYISSCWSQYFSTWESFSYALPSSWQYLFFNYW